MPIHLSFNETFICRRLFTIVILGCTALPTLAADKEKLANIGLQKQLLVDDLAVADTSNVERVLGHVTKANNGKPIVTDRWFYGTVVFDNDRFRMWFTKPGQIGFAYSESRDGLKFSEPVDVTGIPGPTYSVTIDEHESDPRHRYKAAFDADNVGAGLAYSEDGIHWQLYNNGKAVTGRAPDTYNQILWDEAAKTYRLFTRTDFGTGGGPGEIRGSRSMTNSDVKTNPTNWKLIRSWKLDDPKRRQVYALTDWIYEGVHFGIASVYEYPGDFSEGEKTDHVRRHERDVMNYYICTSRDGDKWDLQWINSGQPLIPRGGDSAFDKDILFPSSQIATHDNKHWLYYVGGNERHGEGSFLPEKDRAIGLATLPLDRFVGLQAKAEPGAVTTRPFKLDGADLLINVDCQGGRCLVEVLDRDGKPLAGFTQTEAKPIVQKDDIRLSVKWKDSADLSSLTGQIVRLRFHLQNATLYAFQIASK
ncbi:MAG: hypothetical protein SGJ20_07290 [Planctomycetota bacterium]|nr:hypothetical protein [Planctomycetota bacterium]